MNTNLLTVNLDKLTSIPTSHNSEKNFSINVTYNNIPIESVWSSKYLGLILDQKLTFAEQIKMIETKVSRAIEISSKIKPFLSQKTLISLYYSLLHPHLFSGIAIWASTFDSCKQRLRILQNKAMRIITYARYTDSSNPLCFKLSVLKLDDLFNYECANLMHLSNNGRLPLHLNQQLNFKKVSAVHYHSISQAHAICIPRFSTAKCQRSSKYIETKIWNNNPHELKDYLYSTFKITYKKQLIKKYASSTN